MVDRRLLLRVHGSLLLTSMLWGLNLVALKYLLDRLNPYDVAFIRAAGATVFFALALAITGQLRLTMTRRDWVRLLTVAFAGVTVMNTAMVYAQKSLPATVAALVTTSSPVWTALISWAILGEALTRRKVAGIVLAFGGFLVVLFLGGSQVGSTASGVQVSSMLIMAIAPLAWAIYTVFSKPLLSRYPSTTIAGYATVIGCSPFLFAPVVDGGSTGRLLALPPLAWGAAVFAGGVGIVLSYILWNRGLRVLSATQTAVYLYLVPVFGAIDARLLLGERVTVWVVVGGATILAGVALTNSGRRGFVPTAAAATTPAPAIGGR